MYAVIAEIAVYRIEWHFPLLIAFDMINLYMPTK
jgi:hypothetical protein